MSWSKDRMIVPQDRAMDFFKKNRAILRRDSVDVSGGEITDCVNNPVEIDPLLTGAVVRVPAVLAEFTVQFNVSATIDLPEPVTEIKSIGKRLKITQCLLLQDTNMLFIEGFVRKNFQYATRKYSTSEGVCGDIRHCSVDVPFKCTTAVTFNGLDPLLPVFGSTNEFEYLGEFDLKGPQFANKDRLQTGDFTERNQINTEFFNELPFCQIISSRIVEFDEFLNPIFLAQDNAADDKKGKFYFGKESDVPFEEIEFKSIQEKMVIFLTMKVLQNRQVAIPPLLPAFDCSK